MGGEFLHLGKGHGRIGIVFEIKGAAPASMVAHNSIKQTHGPVFVLLAVGEQFRGINRFSLQMGMSRANRKHGLIETSAHGRQKCNFVSL